MSRQFSRWSATALAVFGAVLIGAPAQAAFLGLDPGDTIDTVNFSIPGGGAVFNDAADTLDIGAGATSIQTTTPEALLEISGGDVDIRLDVVSESLSHVFGTFFSYTATFGGRAGDSDVEIYAPTGGPAPEQDGRLLVHGNVIGAPSLSVFFDSTFGTLPTFTMTGTFSVLAGGDATFESVFGSVGDLADIFASSSSSIPSLAVLLSDGYLFSVRDVDLGVCGGGGDCTGSVLNQSGSWTAGGTGMITPQSPSAFVPEPGTFLLMGGGLLGLMTMARRARGDRSDA